MTILCTICMRGGSKGVNNKNLRLINGRPLMEYTIKQAIESKIFEDIVISTDSSKIADIAQNMGLEVWFKRPKELSHDKAAKIPVIIHALHEGEDISFVVIGLHLLKAEDIVLISTSS